ncbi:MAG: diaminopimelate epimerase [Bacteroidota bacterium]
MVQRTALVVPFTKMNGAGNDFIVLDNRFLRFSEGELATMARRFCPRRTGIGADGLLALEDAEDADFRMRYRNADGSLGTMCGNGARCLAGFAARAGLGTEQDDGVRLQFDTDGGRYCARVPDRGRAGEVVLEVPDAGDISPVEAAGRDGLLRIWTGTEHVVLFVDDASETDVAALGPAIRQDPAFDPTGTNVDFVEVSAGDRLVVRTFEKGVEAETLACGTGAVASALAAHHAGRLGPATGRRSVAVQMPGGTLTVGFDEAGGAVTLAGPAETVYEGTLEWMGE